VPRLRREKSIYDELGGEDKIQEIVELLYGKVLVDQRIARYFDGVDIVRQIEKQKAFLAMVLGGPVQFSGRALSVAHRDLVHRGLSDSHVDALLEDLGAALNKLGVRKSLTARILTTANSFRDEVLSR
jgi:hemoglobin